MKKYKQFNKTVFAASVSRHNLLVWQVQGAGPDLPAVCVKPFLNELRDTLTPSARQHVREFPQCNRGPLGKHSDEAAWRSPVHSPDSVEMVQS